MKPSAFKRLKSETQILKVLDTALALIFSKKYELDADHTLVIESPKFERLTVKHEDRQINKIFGISVDKQCTLDSVLAVSKKVRVNLSGLLTCAIAELTQEVKFDNKLIALADENEVRIGWWNILGIYDKYFDLGNLSVMDTALRGYTVDAANFNCYCLLNNLDITETFEDCMAYHGYFANEVERFTSILTNAAMNEGKFIPARTEKFLNV